MPVDPALTGLTADFTLPSGMNGKIHEFQVAEDFRWKDTEAFSDGGFQTGKLTGQGISGQVIGYINGGSPGLGTYFDQVACTAKAASGRTFPMTISITNIVWGAKVGEIQNFRASFRSSGSYTSGV